MNRLHSVLVVLSLAVLPMVMLYPLWGNPLSAGEDDVVYYYPLRVMAADRLKAGELPLYNPREATGVPLMADPQSAVLHPVTWLFVVLPPKLAYSLSIFGAFSLAGGGAYLYLRRLGLVRAAAMFGAIAFMFCGFMVGHRVHLSVIEAAALLPWSLWCLEGLRRRNSNGFTTEVTERKFIETTEETTTAKIDHEGHKDHEVRKAEATETTTNPTSLLAIPTVGRNVSSSSLRDLRVLRGSSRFSTALWFVPVVFLTIAAGHWPTLIHMALIWAVYGLIRVRPLIPGLLLGGAAVALAGIIAWPQIHVTSQFLAEVTRNKIGYAMAGENSFLPTSAALGLMPFFMGTRNPNFFEQPWWGSWHLCEMLGYVGLVTLAMAMAAMWRLYRKNGNRPYGRPQGRESGFGIRAESAPSLISMLVIKTKCFLAACGLAVSAGKLTDAKPQAVFSREHDLFRSLIPNPVFAVNPESRIPNPVSLVPVVRCWTWLIIGAGIFMLGYYLPTYKLVHMLPVLGVVRCPARMVLAVDFGLATLAAVAIHCVLVAPADERVRRLRRTAIKVVTVVLPLTMAAMVGFWAVLGRALLDKFPDKFPLLPFDGGAEAAVWAASVNNPAVYVPAAMLAITAFVLVVWLRRCGMGRPLGPPSGMPMPRIVLLFLLLADLFWITRFVDVPSPRVGPDVTVSPAAAWLRRHDPDAGSYRVWGLSTSYHTRPDELLLPKTCEAMGFSTIGNYGPFQSAADVELFGFRIWGACRDWESLVRRNHLLSLYGVKYVLAADPEYRKAIEDVRVPESAAPPDGPNLLGDRWQTRQGNLADRFGVTAGIQDSGPDKIVSLKTPFMFWPSWAKQTVRVEPDTLYRISLDALGPNQGAAGFIRAGLGGEDQSLIAEAEQIGTGSRFHHFEWVFQTYPDQCDACFTIYTLSERPIEVKNVSLRRSRQDRPINLGNRLQPGDMVYRKLVELAPLNTGDPPVAIYENRLCQLKYVEGVLSPSGCVEGVPPACVAGILPASESSLQQQIQQQQQQQQDEGKMPSTHAGGTPASRTTQPLQGVNLESLKFPQPGVKIENLRAVDISIPAVDNPTKLILRVTLPAVCLYVLIVGGVVFRGCKKTFSASEA